MKLIPKQKKKWRVDEKKRKGERTQLNKNGSEKISGVKKETKLNQRKKKK